MGKAKADRVPYRDDPDAVSLHTTPDFEALEAATSSFRDADSLPSYHDSEVIAGTERGNTARANRVAHFTDDYSLVQLAGARGWRTETNGKRGSSLEVSARLDPRLMDPDELFKYVSEYLQWMPPKPVVCVSGWHWQTVRQKDKDERKRVTDFDVNLSLGPYLGDVYEWRKPTIVSNGQKAFRGGWRKVRAPGAKQDIEVGGTPERDLRAWVEEFCADKSLLKIFRTARTVSGLNEELVKMRMEQLVRGTHYRGHVDVQVVVEDRAVDIYSDHWINKWRNGWQRYIFYVTFLWIITWPILYFMTKRWAIFTIDWPFSVPWPEQGLRDARRFATISEEEWFTKHEDMIRGLVLDRFQGATDCLGHVPRRSANPEAPRPSGNANVDSAVSLIQAGVGGWNAIRRGMGVDTEGWGHDA